MMKIMERQKTHIEAFGIHWKGRDDKTHEKWVEIHKNNEGELLSVTIGNKEISAFELDILDFLREKGELEVTLE